MKGQLLSATIMALGLVVGGFFAGGRYSMHVIDMQTAIRLDRWTGDISMCALAVEGQQGSCGWELAPPPATANVTDPNFEQNYFDRQARDSN